jgi:hypothetical protein
METENIRVVVKENPGIEVRIVKKATALEPTSHKQLFREATANSEAQR